MSSVQWIVVMSLVGGLVSLVLAALLARGAGVRLVQTLVSYAIGAMLGAVFLDILPHALEDGGDLHVTTATVLAGIFAFFLLEKMVLWRHCHAPHCEAHDAQPAGHDHGRSGMMVLIGGTFHNFVDGILIAAAFVQSTELGIVASLAIIAHAVPQELGDFVVLLHSGFSRVRALVLNGLSSAATLAGGLMAYYFLSAMESWAPTFLALAAASLIYVAVADLIPGLHKRTELRATLQQTLLIALGVTSIWAVGELVGGHV